MHRFLLVLFIMIIPSAVFCAEGKIYSPSFTPNFIIYIMDPEQLAGWNNPLMDHELPYIPEKYRKLPIYGGWHERAYVLDKELLMRDKIKRVFLLSTDAENDKSRLDDLRKMGMDIFVLDAGGIETYPAMLRKLGKYMNIPERGNELADYGDEAIARAKAVGAKVPAGKKVRVYVGHGPDALNGLCNVDILDMAGGINALKCNGISDFPLLSYEDVLAMDPDVILISNPAGRKVLSDPKWQRLRAYREGRVYVVPYGPFGWMHMPEITRFMGAQWMACTLYPGQCDIDLTAETKRFMKLFFHMDLTDAQADGILYRENRRPVK